jgi:Transposase domain (DUF772)
LEGAFLMKIAKGGNRQRELIPRARKATIPLSEQHPMVVLTDALDWTEMEVRAEKIRAKKLKNAAGRLPHLRALLGALTVMAVRRLPYRETEEQIRYYASARYLCGLTETEWTPDFTTIQDFSQLVGQDGVKLINEYVVELAVELGLADPKRAVAGSWRHLEWRMRSYGDALGRILACRPVERREMGRKGHERVRRLFDPARVRAEFVAIYRAVLEDRGLPGEPAWTGRRKHHWG